MRQVETFIRTTELGLALASTYMTAVTLLRAPLYAKFKPILLSLLRYAEPILGWLPIEIAYLDLSVLAVALAMSLLLWRRGDEAGFGRLFSLNMLLFFPSVVDFSMFNWVNLILPYDPEPGLPRLQVFGVGLLLQVTYISLRYTIRFRELRGELIGRGAEVEDVDRVSRGQMAYLALLVAGAAAVVAAIYYATPLVKGLLISEAAELPYPHIVIGVVCSIVIAAATIVYLRGYATETTAEIKPPAEPARKARGRR